jgi:hypothetical protein
MTTRRGLFGLILGCTATLVVRPAVSEVPISQDWEDVLEQRAMEKAWLDRANANLKPGDMHFVSIEITPVDKLPKL